MLDESAQWRSSRSSTSDVPAASAPSASPSSRSMRSLLAPMVSPSSCSWMPLEAKAAGSCKHQVGALARNTARARSL